MTGGSKRKESFLGQFLCLNHVLLFSLLVSLLLFLSFLSNFSYPPCHMLGMPFPSIQRLDSDKRVLVAGDSFQDNLPNDEKSERENQVLSIITAGGLERGFFDNWKREKRGTQPFAVHTTEGGIIVITINITQLCFRNTWSTYEGKEEKTFNLRDVSSRKGWWCWWNRLDPRIED